MANVGTSTQAGGADRVTTISLLRLQYIRGISHGPY